MNSPVVIQSPGAVPGDIGLQSRLAGMFLNRDDSGVADVAGTEAVQQTPLAAQQSGLPVHSSLAVEYAQALLQLRQSEKTAPRLDDDRRRVQELNGIVVKQLEADGLIGANSPSHVVIAYFQNQYHLLEFLRDPANGDAICISKSFEIINVDELVDPQPVHG